MTKVHFNHRKNKQEIKLTQAVINFISNSPGGLRFRSNIGNGEEKKSQITSTTWRRFKSIVRWGYINSNMRHL